MLMEERLCRLEPCGVEILRQKNTIKYPLSVVPSFIALCDEGPKAHVYFVCFLFMYSFFITEISSEDQIKIQGFLFDKMDLQGKMTLLINDLPN